MNGQAVERRVHEEDDLLLPFQVDVQKILHSKAYARYADKTQVVYLLPHDHISSRGLHVQLVSFFARSVGKNLQAYVNNTKNQDVSKVASRGFLAENSSDSLGRVDIGLDLIEAISLGHDMGHAPFGHEGEIYLSELSEEHGCGAFSHARQSCRIAEEIENLNLTFAVLDGFLTHDGGLQNADIAVNLDKNWMIHEEELKRRLIDSEIDLKPFSYEAALVKICDTVCYLQRDLKDALTLGIVSAEQLPSTCFGIHGKDIMRVVGLDIVSSYAKTGKIQLSKTVFEQLKQIRTFNFENIYIHKSLKTESRKIHTAYRLLFEQLLDDWKQKGKQSILWQHYLRSKSSKYVDSNRPEQLILDYVAGMTDGYFLRIFESLFLPKTIAVPDVLPFS